MAKLAREREIKERRARKLEKKRAAAERKRSAADAPAPNAQGPDGWSREGAEPKHPDTPDPS
jgi:hypothetical protein